MPNINRISGAVRDSTFLSVLAAKDELDEGLPVDPVRLADYLETAEHKPAVAHVLFLLRTSIESAAGCLSFTQPPSELVSVDAIDPSGYREGGDASPNLSGVRLGSRTGTVTAIEISTSENVLDSFVDVDQMEQA
jgi:hypothetical protein